MKGRTHARVRYVKAKARHVKAKARYVEARVRHVEASYTGRYVEVRTEQKVAHDESEAVCDISLGVARLGMVGHATFSIALIVDHVFRAPTSVLLIRQVSPMPAMPQQMLQRRPTKHPKWRCWGMIPPKTPCKALHYSMIAVAKLILQLL